MLVCYYYYPLLFAVVLFFFFFLAFTSHLPRASGVRWQAVIKKRRSIPFCLGNFVSLFKSAADYYLVPWK